MKKNFRKKLLGLSLSGLLVVLPFCNFKVEEVKATTCEDYTNYYFFLQVHDPSTRFGQEGDDPLTFPKYESHYSSFKSDLPEGADVTTAQYNWIDLNAGEDGWTVRKYWKISNSITKGDLGSGKFEKDETDETIWYYTHLKSWASGSNGEILDTYTDPTKYELDALIANTYVSGTDDAELFKLRLSTDGEDITGSIKRTINDDWTEFAANSEASYVNGVHPTERHVFLPGLLQVKYKVCNTAAPTTHKVTIKYIEEGTDKEIRPDDNIGSFAEGASYSAQCFENVGDYKLTSNKDLKGTMGTTDVILYCKYKSTKPTYNLTVNYLDRKTKKSIKDPYTDPTNYKSGDKYTATCPAEIGSDYTFDSSSGNLNGTFADKNIVVNCLYTNEAPPTSDIPIYLVWTVGGAALAYIIYYFRKYYKAQNTI